MNKKYDCIPSPIGDIYVLVTERGVCGVEIGMSRDEFLAAHADAVRDEAALSGVLDLLRRYLDGEEVSLDSIDVDLSAGTAFQQAAWRELRKVPRGRTISYGELSCRVGRPGAARAIGNAMGRNPVPIIVPCHRVLHAGGGLGGFSSGLDVKRFLLRLENCSSAAIG